MLPLGAWLAVPAAGQKLAICADAPFGAAWYQVHAGSTRVARLLTWQSAQAVAVLRGRPMDVQ